MTPTDGSPDYIVRVLIREESGWWDRSPHSLHTAHPDEAAQARFYALSEPEKIIAKAKALAADGEIQLALHVVDLLPKALERTVCPGGTPPKAELRLRKRNPTLCQQSPVSIQRRPPRDGSFLERSSVGRCGLSWAGGLPPWAERDAPKRACRKKAPYFSPQGGVNPTKKGETPRSRGWVRTFIGRRVLPLEGETF